MWVTAAPYSANVPKGLCQTVTKTKSQFSAVGSEISPNA